MSYCDRDNYNPITKEKTTCFNGYDAEKKACCNYGMFIFWQVCMWLALFLCCGICVYMMVSRARTSRNAQAARMQE